MKWIGLAIIFSCCTVCGIWIDEDQRKRLKELERFIYLFELLKAEIDYQLTPLKEACIQITYHEEGVLKRVFLYFSKQLEEKKSVDVGKMWAAALEEYRGELHLKEADYNIIKSFGNACGYLDKNMQKRNLDMVIEKIEHERKLSEMKYEKCSKLNKALGMLVGAVLVIFLI